MFLYKNIFFVMVLLCFYGACVCDVCVCMCMCIYKVHLQAWHW